MKKLAIGILGAAFIFGAGTYTLAQGTEDGLLNFKEMKPYMEKMHPTFSDKELKDMYKACHGDDGMMENKNPEKMMDKL
ncbi:hypothetical protein [Cytobacillus praedii]|uniref:hypothetical protein n=1 Tax=Cytobacillus praedii TaxID=1742358 RepID=UPI002E1DEDA7|nr:hypothetical protein [Cytobacillus praedii]